MAAPGDCGAVVRVRRAARVPLGIAIAMCCVPPDASASILEVNDGVQPVGRHQNERAAAAGEFDGIFVSAERAPAQSADVAASELGLAAIAEAMRADAAIKEILRDILPPVTSALLARDVDERGEQSQFQIEGAAEPKSAAAASRARRSSARNTEIEDAAIETDGSGAPSLRQVLHAIAVPAPTGRAQTSEVLGDQDGDDDDARPGFDLTSRLLESRVLGEAMEHIIEVDSVDNSFSIFGAGRFEFQIGGADHGFVLTDLTSNFSIDLSPTSSPDAMPRQPRAAVPKIDVLAIMLGFLESATGTITSIFAGTLLLLWSTMRIAARLRR
jgi:hypothetical protein